MTIVDWVTIIVALTGATTGVIALVKSFRVDRRVRLDAYFRNVWSEIRSPLNSDMQTISNWLNTLWSSGAQELLPHIPSKRTVIQIDNYDWAYDKRLCKLIRSYETRIQQLEYVVGQYNWLLYPTTGNCAQWILYGRSLSEGSIADDVEKKLKQPEELEKVRKRNEEQAKTVLEIAQKYIDPEREHSFEVLRQNKDYQRDLGVLRARVRKSIEQARRIMKQIDKTVNFYNRLFGESGPTR